MAPAGRDRCRGYVLVAAEPCRVSVCARPRSSISAIRGALSEDDSIPAALGLLRRP